MQQGSPRTTVSVPMAAPSITALYPNSDAAPSGKKSGYTYDEMLLLLKRRGASHSVRELIRDAIVVRSRWPKKQGSISAVVTVSVKSLENESGLWRSTIQRRLRRAQKELCLRQTRDMNSWLNCPKCGTARQTAKCPKCPHKGNGLDHKEFRRTFTYEIDFGHLERLAHCRGHVTEIPRNPPPQDDPPQDDPHPKSPAPVAPQPQRQQPAAETTPRENADHHRSTERALVTQATSRLNTAAKRLMELCGLPDIGSAAPYVEAAILAESKFRGAEIEEAAKYLSDCVLRDQRAGITVGRFYFRDAKWRNGNGTASSASSERADRIKRNILDGFAANARAPDQPDGPEREE